MGFDLPAEGRRIRRRDTELTLKNDQDTAATDNVDSDVEDIDAGASVSIDWESEDNPYKNRFSGEQRRSTKLESERDVALSNLSSVSKIDSRLGTLEDLIADIADRGSGRADRDELDFDDEFDEDVPKRTTGKAREKIQESRQASAVRENNAQAQKVYDRLQEGWGVGMDAKSPEMLEVTRLYNEALEDPAKSGQLNTALTLFNSYKRFVTLAAPKSPLRPTPKSEGDGDGDEGAADANDGDDDTILDDDGNDGKQTARQRNKAKGAGQGQEGVGSSVPRDQSQLTPTQKFALHEDGKTPANY